MNTTKASWGDVEPKLAEYGVDTAAIKPLQQAALIARIDADGLLEEASLRPEAFGEYTDALIEEHPAWETAAHRRVRHAVELLEEHSNSQDYCVVEDTKEWAGYRYMVVASSDYRDFFAYPAGDDRDIAQLVFEVRDQERRESIDHIFDLDSGEEYQPQLEESVTINGITYTAEDLREAQGSR